MDQPCVEESLGSYTEHRQRDIQNIVDGAQRTDDYVHAGGERPGRHAVTQLVALLSFLLCLVDYARPPVSISAFALAASKIKLLVR